MTMWISGAHITEVLWRPARCQDSYAICSWSDGAWDAFGPPAGILCAVCGPALGSEVAPLGWCIAAHICSCAWA